MIVKTLRRIIQEVTAAPGLAEALNLAVAQVKDALGVDACSIFLADDERGIYLLQSTVGLNAEAVGKAKIKYGQGLIGLVGQREEPINLANAPEHSQFHRITSAEEEPYLGFMGVPLISKGELLGVLTVQLKEERMLDKDESTFLITLSAQLAGSIATASAKGELQDLNQPKRRKRKDTILLGQPGSPGIAIGSAVVVFPPADLDAVPDKPTDDVDEEIRLFEAALAMAREDIYEIQMRARSTLSVAENALFEAYLRILDSRSLMNEVETEIKEGLWAQAALKRVIKQHVLQFESLDDPYLQERASDFRDLGRRILAHLQSSKRSVPDYPKDTILVSEEVTATLLMEVPEGHLRGVISATGSSNSHVAILARALGLPTVMGLTGSPITQFSNKECIVDGYNGHVYMAPSGNLKKEFKHLIEEEQQLDDELSALRELPAETTDEHTLALYVNTGLAMDGSLSLSAGAEGVGLYRTELPFMLRDRFPSEEEQRIMYRQLLNVFSPRPVVMRTLDIGGDKSLSYFPVEEANPFLGWRGIRITLDHPDIFLQQVRAMLHASSDLNNLSIMLPMISSVYEVDECKRLINQAYQEICEEQGNIKKPKIGIMIEVPAAVYQCYELAKRVDFISVGSNDLIQYLLAVDRNNPHVASIYDGLHPAVLRALSDVVKLARRAKRPVSICGELAADPIASVLLLGMGYTGLSMSARSLPRVKWVIRNFSLARAKELVKVVLKMDDAREIRAYLELALDEAGLGGLIRAGR